MSVEFQELRDAVRQVVDGLDKLGAEQDFWHQCLELGWLMVAAPEELGGLGMGSEAAVAVQLELGRGLSGAPYLPAAMAVSAICDSSLGDKSERLENLFAGEAITAALVDGGLKADGQTLNGSLSAVLSADTATQLLLWTDDASLVAIAELSHSAISIRARETWDTTRRLFDVECQALPVADLTVLAEGADAQAMVKDLRMQRDLGVAADAVGAATALLDMTVEHLNTRIQFRRPLAMFQALKHRCADMKTLCEASEALLISVLGTDSAADVMAAKQMAASHYATVAEEALQLHGGIGMAVEHPCHLYLKRAMLNPHLGTSSAACAESAVQALLDSVA